MLSYINISHVFVSDQDRRSTSTLASWAWR